MRNTAKPGPYQTPGSQKLDALIEERGLSTAAVASEIARVGGKTAPYARCTVHNWRHGIMRPDVIGRAHIELWSRKRGRGGKLGEPTIVADDWLLESERAAIAAVREAS